MSRSLSVQALFDALESRLKLEWVIGREAAQREIDSSALNNSAYAMAGYLNVIRPAQITVIANAECRYIEDQDPRALDAQFARVCAEPTVIIIVASGQQVPPPVVSQAEANGVAVFSTRYTGNETLNNLRYYLSYSLAESTTLHGVFLEVNGIGVLVTGESGLGKSELALELITRGHRIIADDAPEFARVAPDLLEGSCPELLSGFLEVRGLGILNIRRMFGDGAVKRQKYLRLIIRLVAYDREDEAALELERLGTINRYRKVLDVDVPETTLPVAPGRNLAVLVEAAALAHAQMVDGYVAANDLIERQERMLQRNAR